MTFCYSPWTNVDIGPQGDISPCCKFQTQYYDEKFNIQSHTIKQYAESKFVTQIKQEFKQDQWPRGCERCQLEEENNILSKRQMDWDRWNQHYQTYDIDQPTFLTVSIAFGNTCNLTCITCNPISSSRWQQEYQTLFGIDIKPHHFLQRIVC
jgi:radical SAM protein with 4Fe4S-binding SPASM domain